MGSDEEDKGILWDLQAAQPISTSLNGDFGRDSEVSPFIPNSHWLLGRDESGGLAIWDLGAPGNKPLALAESDKLDPRPYISPNGVWIVALGRDHELRAWNMGDTSKLRILRGHDSDMREVHFRDDGHTLVTLAVDGELRQWDLQQPTAALPVFLEGHDVAITALAFDSTNETLISLDEQEKVLSWDLQRDGAAPEYRSIVFTSFQDNSRLQYPWFMLDPAGRWLVYRSIVPPQIQSLSDESVNQECYDLPSQYRSSVLFSSPNGRWLAYLLEGDKTTVYICNMIANERARPVQLLEAPELRSEGASSQQWALSSDARWLAHGAANGTIDLWDGTSPLARLPVSLATGSTKPISLLAFSPREARLVVAQEDMVSVVDIEAKNEFKVLALEPATTVTSIGFSQDGNSLAVGSDDGRIQVWDMRAMDAQPKVWRLPKTAIRSLAFGHDNSERWIAAGGKNGAIYLIGQDRQDLPVLEDSACKLVGRNLTLDEWQQFMGENTPYRKTCEEWPAHNTVIESMLKKGSRLAQQGSLKEAESAFQEALKLDPGLNFEPEARARSGLASAFISEGRDLAKQGLVTGATEKFQEAITLDPSQKIEPAAEAKRIYASTLVEQARDLAAEGNIDDAVALFKEALALDPSQEIKPEIEAKRIYASNLVEQARDLAAEGNIDDAVALFKEALALNPSQEIEPEIEAKRIYVSVLLKEAQDFARDGDIANAAAKLKEILALDPSQKIEPEWDAKRLYASRLIRESQDLEEQGKNDSAVAKRQQALALGVTRPLTPGQAATGTIIPGTSDFRIFEGKAGQMVTIDMLAHENDLDSFLLLYGPDLKLMDEDDDSGRGYNSRLRSLELSIDGTYLLVARGFDTSSEGAYELKMNVR
jgi:WD40 repeat protein